MNDGIVIAGGGLAGQRCTEALRRGGYEGPIRIVCAESRAPYDRPPLSKELLSGSGSEDTLAYRPAEWYSREAIDLLLGVRAVRLSPAERCLALSDGSTLRYDRLLIATGSRPRTLPILDRFTNVSVLRTVEDATRLREVLRPGARLAVIGAGFIGQEVAATARKLSVEVTMIEAAQCPLAGILGEPLGSWFADMHRAEGVEVICGSTVQEASGNGAVESLTLSSGWLVEVDHVVVGVGVQAEVDWLAGSGLGVPLRVDPHGRTELEDVFAVGDAASTYDPVAGGHVPGSHWEAAGRQGARAARAMLGLEPGGVPPTSFWTDQYGIRIQYLGHARLADATILHGDLGSRNFTAIFTRAGRAVAALLVDRPRSLPAARKAIETGETDDLLS